MVRNSERQWGPHTWPWKGVIPILWKWVISSGSQLILIRVDCHLLSNHLVFLLYLFPYDPCHISFYFLWILFMWCCPPDFHQNTMLTLCSWTPRAMSYRYLFPLGWQYGPTGKSSCCQAWWCEFSPHIPHCGRRKATALSHFLTSTHVPWHDQTLKLCHLYVFNYHHGKYWARKSWKHFWENNLFMSLIYFIDE